MRKETEDILDEVGRERYRQVSDEGWTNEHDDEHDAGELSDAAACYALGDPRQRVYQLWPWSLDWWKPTTARRNLVKSAALIVAEIERLDRE